MNSDIDTILKDLNSWKNSKNIANAKKAEKVANYLRDFQDGEISKSELQKLLESQVAIDEMKASAEEMRLVKKINDLSDLIRNLF